MSRLFSGSSIGSMVLIAVGFTWLSLLDDVLTKEIQSQWMPLILTGFVASAAGCFIGGLAAVFFVPATNDRRDAILWASVYGGFIAAGIAVGASVILGVLVAITRFLEAGVILACLLAVVAGVLGGWLGGRIADRSYPHEADASLDSASSDYRASDRSSS